MALPRPEVNCNDYTWQPARIINAHGTTRKEPEFAEQKIAKLILRVRPYDIPVEYGRNLCDGSQAKCDATKFYLVHPDDIPPNLRRQCNGEIACEHMVLTD